MEIGGRSHNFITMPMLHCANRNPEQASTITYQPHSFVRGWYEPTGEPLRAAGKAIDALLPQCTLVLFTSWGDPTTMCYNRRRGWLFREPSFAAPLRQIALLKIGVKPGHPPFSPRRQVRDEDDGPTTTRFEILCRKRSGVANIIVIK
jgi:hypothetical protein